MTPTRARGFTLLEVLIALLILALSLGVLLTSQASSLDKVSRARGMSVAALLARGKMIDIEQHLFDEGFTEGDERDEGNFEEEGHGDYTWSYVISEVEMDLGSLGSLCGGFGEEGGDATDCDSLFGSLGVGGGIDGFMESISDSLRAVELTVTWPDGGYTESRTVRALVSRNDFSLASPALPGQSGGSGALGQGTQAPGQTTGSQGGGGGP